VVQLPCDQNENANRYYGGWQHRQEDGECTQALSDRNRSCHGYCEGQRRGCTREQATSTARMVPTCDRSAADCQDKRDTHGEQFEARRKARGA
jgi:hypothetical protein